MSAPATRADAPDGGSRLRRLVQAGYVLQALSLLLALFGDPEILSGLDGGLPAGVGVLVLWSQRDALKGTRLASHATWQSRTFWIALGTAVLATLLLGPLLFIGLSYLGWALGLIAAWAGWRIARGVLALLKDQPLPTRSGNDA